MLNYPMNKHEIARLTRTHARCPLPADAGMVEVTHFTTVGCERCNDSYSFPVAEPIHAAAQALLAQGTCLREGCGAAITQRVERAYRRFVLCCAEGCVEEGEPQYSLGIYAGYYCEHHSEEAFPFVRYGAAAFSSDDAGEEDGSLANESDDF